MNRAPVAASAVLCAVIGCGGASIAPTTFSPEVVASCEAELFAPPSDARRIGTQGLVVVVNLLDECGMNRQFMLRQAGGDEPELTAITVVGQPVEVQVSEGLREGLSNGEACESVRVRRLEPAELSQNAVTGLLRDFRDIRVRPTIDGPFVTHGRLYEVFIFTAGDHSYFEFQGVPGEQSPDLPLQIWADRVFSTLGFECR